MRSRRPGRSRRRRETTAAAVRIGFAILRSLLSWLVRAPCHTIQSVNLAVHVGHQSQLLVAEIRLLSNGGFHDADLQTQALLGEYCRDYRVFLFFRAIYQAIDLVADPFQFRRKTSRIIHLGEPVERLRRDALALGVDVPKYPVLAVV